MLDAVVVSDVHCDGPDSPTQVAFLRFLGGLRTRRLVLAGDIFHTFWCPAGVPFPAYRPVLDALADFDLVVLPGNHDWALGRFFAASAEVAIGTTAELRLGHLTAEVTHGDEVDESPATAASTGCSAALRSGGRSTGWANGAPGRSSTSWPGASATARRTPPWWRGRNAGRRNASGPAPSSW